LQIEKKEQSLLQFERSLMEEKAALQHQLRDLQSKEQEVSLIYEHVSSPFLPFLPPDSLILSVLRPIIRDWRSETWRKRSSTSGELLPHIAKRLPRSNSWSPITILLLLLLPLHLSRHTTAILP
jgi:hypothetical protein